MSVSHEHPYNEHRGNSGSMPTKPWSLGKLSFLDLKTQSMAAPRSLGVPLKVSQGLDTLALMHDRKESKRESKQQDPKGQVLRGHSCSGLRGYP